MANTGVVLLRSKRSHGAPRRRSSLITLDPIREVQNLQQIRTTDYNGPPRPNDGSAIFRYFESSSSSEQTTKRVV